MANKIKQKPAKTIKISIATKLIAIISFLIIVSLTSMIAFASFFFKEDSELRINENNHNTAQLISSKVRSDFTSILKMADMLSSAMSYESNKKGGSINDITDKLFSREKDIFYLAYAKPTGNDDFDIKKSYFNKNIFSETDITQDKIVNALKSQKSKIIKSFSNLQYIVNISSSLKIPSIALSIPVHKQSGELSDTIIIACVSVSGLIEAVKTGGIVTTAIVNSDGDIIAHSDMDMVMSNANISNLPIVAKMMSSPIDNGQIRYKDLSGKSLLGSFKKIDFAGIGVISSVDEDTAFSAVSRIIRRNTYILIIVLCAAIIVGFFFSKTITRPIFSLVKVMHKVEEGNFDYRITRIPNDEMGVLMKSFNEMSKGLKEREKMKVAFGRFVNKEIAERVLRDEIKLGGEKKNVSVFFSDIRSFTSMSEKLQPEEVVNFLNEYFTKMVKCVNDSRGIVDKFIGDAIMALFGTPMSYGNDTENAVNCALAMRKVLIEYNNERTSSGKNSIHIGCGINTGPVLAGQIGTSDRMEYTVIGDTVNLASRIESLNKTFGTDILISNESYHLVSGIFTFERMKPIIVRGKLGPQTVWAVLGRKDDHERPKTLIELRKMIGIEDKSQIETKSKPAVKKSGNNK